jgi:hypothetical protein
MKRTRGFSGIWRSTRAPARSFKEQVDCARCGGRWSVPGAGKRGGVRVIYFHVAAQSQLRLLLIYRKGVKDDLTAAEKKTLRKLNRDW